MRRRLGHSGLQELLAKLPGDPVEAVLLNPADVNVLEQIGRGGFATVHTAVWNGTRVAVKKWNKPADAAVIEDELKLEVALLLRLRHPNVLNVFGVVLKVLAPALHSTLANLHGPSPGLHFWRRTATG